MVAAEPDPYQEIREAVRALCARFPCEYFRQVDRDRAYPEAFVVALTEAGWLAALIPQDYGGSGLGLAIANSLTKLHGGSMRLRSKLGSGTVVMVTLPRDKAVLGAGLSSAAA